MYYLAVNGERTGPYEAIDIQRMLRQNAIGYETLFWKDGMLDWQSVGSQKHLFETSYQSPPQQQPYQQPAFQQQAYQQPQYQQQSYQQQPMQVYQQPVLVQPLIIGMQKSRLSYILLGLFLGGLGIHNFYAGYSGKGVAQLLLTLLLFWTIVVPIGVWIWIIVEICTVDTDAYGNRMM
jgi:TM2 domain-containing membrane protein YozV